MKGDIRDSDLLEKIFAESKFLQEPIEAVIHFAGMKSVGESINNPLHYWDGNVTGSRTFRNYECQLL